MVSRAFEVGLLTSERFLQEQHPHVTIFVRDPHLRRSGVGGVGGWWWGGTILACWLRGSDVDPSL